MSRPRVKHWPKTPHSLPRRWSDCADTQNGALDGETFYQRQKNGGIVKNPDKREIAWEYPLVNTSGKVALPSMFSGAMRNVVQALYGVQAVIPFSPTWANTHGIHIQQTARGPVPWVIMINAGGVFARKLPVCSRRKSTIKGQAELKNRIGGVPHRVPLDFVTKPKTWRQIATAKQMEPFYEKGPVFSDCGWAFNLDGSAAVNTCMRYENEQEEPADGWEMAWPKYYRYKLLIHDDGNGPSGASLQYEEDGFLWGCRDCGFKIPAGDRLMSVNPYIPGNSAPPGDRPAPIYSFFRGNSQVNLRYYRYVPGQTESYDNLPSSFHYGCTPAEWEKGVRTYGEKNPGLRAGDDRLANVAKNSSYKVVRYVVPISGPIAYFSTSDYLHTRDSNGAFSSLVAYENHEDITSYHYGGIIPVGDREAYYLYELKTERTGYDRSSYRTADGYDGQFTYERISIEPGLDRFGRGLSNCDAGSDCGEVRYYEHDPNYDEYKDTCLTTNQGYQTYSAEPPLTLANCKLGVDPIRPGWCGGSSNFWRPPLPPQIPVSPDIPVQETTRSELLELSVNGITVNLYPYENEPDGPPPFDQGNEYTQYVTDFQFMHSVPDVNSGLGYASKEMNGMSGPGYIVLGNTSYPISKFSNARFKWWVGFPGPSEGQ